MEGKKIVFFGTGSYSNLTNIQPLISYFCDNSPLRQGQDFYRLPIYSPDKLLEENKENTLIVINTEYYQEIAKQLFDMGFEDIYCNEYQQANERINCHSNFDDVNFLHRKSKAILQHDIAKVRNIFTDDLSKIIFDNLLIKFKHGIFDFSDIRCNEKMYFNNIFRGTLQDNEVYIDAGVFDGKTLIEFIKFANGKCKKIYAFEPDLIGYTALRKEFSDLDNVILLQKGLSHTDGEAYFDMRGTMSSKIIESFKRNEHLTKIATVKLDSVVNEPVTFIKMDIEGGEYNALHGARETIMKHKPKLAISVYHEVDDLVRIPLLIHDFVPEYKFYLRHHTVAHVDTVLYAKFVKG